MPTACSKRCSTSRATARRYPPSVVENSRSATGRTIAVMTAISPGRKRRGGMLGGACQWFSSRVLPTTAVPMDNLIPVLDDILRS